MSEQMEKLAGAVADIELAKLSASGDAGSGGFSGAASSGAIFAPIGSGRVSPGSGTTTGSLAAARPRIATSSRGESSGDKKRSKKKGDKEKDED